MKSDLLTLFLLLESSAPGWAMETSARIWQRTGRSSRALALRPAPRHRSDVISHLQLLRWPCPSGGPQEDVSSPSFFCARACLAERLCSGRAAANLLSQRQVLSYQGLDLVPESPQHSARGSQDLSRCPPKCFQWGIQLLGRRKCFNI